MAQKKRGLGRGLDALLGGAALREDNAEQDINPEYPDGQAVTATGNSAGLRELPVEFIRPGKYQPRQHFEDSALDDLAASIRSQGLLQPLVVRPIGTNQYELIAGERRWRASQRVGLANVPVVIREVDDEATIAMALIENLQREDLNPLESALGMRRLIDEFDMTHEQVAGVVGMNRATASNSLRL